jgi:hypothetical protein
MERAAGGVIALWSIGGGTAAMPFRFRRQWRIERANAQEVGRSLRRLGISSKDVSDAVPCLFRSATTYKLYQQKLSWSSIPGTLVFLIPYFVIFSSDKKSSEINILSNLRDPEVSNLAGALLFSILGVWLVINPPRQKVFGERRSIKNQVLSKGFSRLSPANVYFNMLAPLFGREMRPVSPASIRLIGVLSIIFFGGGGALLAFAMNPSNFLFVGIVAPLIALYFILSIYLAIRLLTVFSRWRLAPDVALVHELRSAFTLACSGKASEWRSFAYRREIAAHLSEAANILEGPMLRIMPGNVGGIVRAVVQTNIQTVAAGLRQKLSWLVTPKPDTAEYLARAIGEVLVVAATGNLDRLLGSQMGVTTDAHFRWQDQLTAFARWAIVALGPALAVLLGWSLLEDLATRTLAVQFAVVSFLNATFSAVVQRGDDRLSSIVNLGGSVFGWGRPKG